LTLATYSIPVSACARLAWFDGTGRGISATNIASVTAEDDVSVSMQMDIKPNDRSGAVCRSRDLDGNGKVNFRMSLQLRD